MALGVVWVGRAKLTFEKYDIDVMVDRVFRKQFSDFYDPKNRITAKIAAKLHGIGIRTHFNSLVFFVEAQMNKKKILLVDDDLILLTVAKTVLGEEFEVVTVSSGFDAIEIMATQTFDLVLLDHQMPVLDGFGTLKAIRQFWPEQYVVFCSSTVSEENLRAFSSAGAHGAICKPANIGKLPVLVAAFLT